MLPKYHVILHVYNVHSIIRIIFFKILQNLKLNSSLIVVLLFVLNDLQSHKLLPFVIEAFQSNAKRALSQELLDLIPKSDMISHDNLVIALVIIIAKVVFTLQGAFDFLATLAEIKNLRIVKNLLHLKSSQVLLEILQGLGWSKWELQVLYLVYRIIRSLTSKLLLMLLKLRLLSCRNNRLLDC